MENAYQMPEFTKDISKLEARNPNISFDNPSDQVKPKNTKALIYIVVAVVSFVMLIFIALVTWKLVSLDKALAEERQRIDNVSNGAMANADITKLRSLIENNTKNIQSVRTEVGEHFSVAFHATVSVIHPIISIGDKIPFDNVTLNIGNGYNAITMVFTVPPGAAGLYFLTTHVVTDDGKIARFVMKKNTEILTGFFEDNRSSPETDGSASCSITTLLKSGDVVFVEKVQNEDDKPLDCRENYCGFTGFLMKPINN